MLLHRQRAQTYLQQFDFESLFIEELGWDTVDRVMLPFEVDGEAFEVVAIAQKRGFIVYQCLTPEIPARPIRVKLDRQLTDYSKSHLLIFGDAGKTRQTWMWVRQEPGKPLAPRFEQYQVGQSAERLMQKLEALAIAFAEEERLTLVEVAQRVKKAFDVEKVTKKFFTQFEKEHGQFLKFIDGIQSEFDRTWYASLMLNRLMFVYFIQRKKFLDDDREYLRNRLKRCQAEWGTDTFHSFYRQFLLKLFHEGLGQPGRDAELDKLLGKVPYLNGGLFEVHQLEEKYENTIQIPDAAFEQVFNFFDEYDWHLDDRPLRNQNEINPDVLGYIFEKYINQKQMGAYYTKEDITEYISKNTIIPFLFDAAKKRCPGPFKPPHPLTPSPKEGEGGQEGSAPLSPPGRGARGEGSPDYWTISPALRQQMTEAARQFRKEPTPSEAILWQALRSRKLEGRKFKRQQPIGAFVVDFFCGAEQLIVEVDGSVHETQQEYDQQRQELLEYLGLRFVRVSSQQVETNLNEALETIRSAFRPHPLTPSPKEGEGGQEGSAPLSPSVRGVGGFDVSAQPNGEGNSRAEGSIWVLLQENPDHYIYPAVRHGVDLELPDNIAAGINDVSQRGGWNKAAADGFALPTETWREHVARRKRCLELRQKLTTGEITSIDDLITYNLDIRQFAQDVITSCESSDLLKALYQAIEQVSVLDPTCGSGAFLFAALNILEPLYTACLERMHGFVDEDDARFPHPLAPSPKVGEGGQEIPAPLSLSGRGAGGEGLTAETHPHPLTPFPKEGEGEQNNQSPSPLMGEGFRVRGSEGKPRYEYFRKVLAEMATHPNPRYFVLKSIMLNNLYGVDIMEEATEICKLRLFLKLVAQMEPQPKQPNFGLEPLPDIDFNIRAGNTLVGFASLDEVRKAIKQDGAQLKLDLQDDASRIDEKAELADRAFQRFRQMQTEFGMDAIDFRGAKKELRRRLAELNEELNRYLAEDYGIDVKKSVAFEKWRDSHQPFHWFVEFYSIIDRGGFDVIIGNPPYVEYSKVKRIYSIKNYQTESCGNLYAYSLERAAVILRQSGKLGFIIPVASVCTDGYTPLQRILREKGSITISNFNDRPSKLFDGLEHIRLTIVLWKKHNGAGEIYTTKYNKWQAIERNSLFDCLTYSTCTVKFIIDGSIPKVHSLVEQDIFNKLLSQKRTIDHFSRQNGSHAIYYTRKLSGFVQILNFIPEIYDSTGESRNPSELKAIKFDTKTTRDVYLALLNSNLFYWFLTIYSDCRNLNKRELIMIPLDFEDVSESIASDLSVYCNQLMQDFCDNSKMLEMRYEKLGKMTIQCVYPKFSKPIIDEIDRVLAQHYGFTDEELDFIINYDIKYRMGRNSGGDDS